MKRLMQVGTIVTLVSVAALVGSVIWVVQEGGWQETRELVQEHRAMPTPSLEEAALRQQGHFYSYTYRIFLMDDELDEGECGTLRDLAGPLADRIADSGGADRDYAESISALIDRIEQTCQ